MITNFKFRKFFGKARKIVPPGDLKDRARQNVLMYMKSQPVSAPAQHANIFMRFAVPALAVVFLAVGGASASFAAQSALPGDPLYFFKVNVNEKAALVLANSAEKKARLKLQFAQNRFEEAEKLALSNKLSSKIQSQIEKQLQKDIDEAFKNGDDFSSDFDALMNAHSRILRQISENDQNIKPYLAPIISKLQAKQQQVALKIDQVDQQKVKQKIQAAQDAINKAREIAEKNKQKMREENFEEIRQDIARAELELESGKQMFEQQNFGQSYVSLQQSQRIAQESRIIAQTNGNVNLNMSINSSGSENIVDLSNSGLTVLPEGITASKGITKLILANNKLTSLPNDIANLKDTLKLLDLTGNPISPEEITKLKTLLPNTQITY